MKVAGGGFDQCYNAQAVVATGSLLVVSTGVTQAGNDKQQLAPLIDQLKGLPEDAGSPPRDAGRQRYLSEANVDVRA